MRRWMTVGLVAAMVGVHAAPAGASAPSFAATGACREHQAFVDGDGAAVAARLPKRYAPVIDPSSGRPLLFARALDCDAVSLGDHTGPVRVASFGIVIASPDGRGCASGAPVIGMVYGELPPVCNWYTLFWLANDRRVVDWLRDGTPDFPAVYVPGLRFKLGAFDPAQGGEPLHVEAPAPSPSPFTMDEIARERPGAISVRGGYWADTAEGTVKVAFSSDDLTSGDATGTVHAQPGSEMARLFGAGERSYLPGYSTVAAERWSHAAYRKQLLGPARPGETLHSFAGSCSVQGTVHFTPPATTTVRPLVYSYDATGTCGSKPVKLHQAGTADGACQQAQTTEPGRGTLAFPDGTTVAYTLDFTDVASQVAFTFYGERSGTAGGQGTFLTQRSTPDAVTGCGGEGDSDVPMDLTLTTDTPLVSATSSGAASREGATAPATAPGARRPSLRLAVRPATVAAGRRTSFAFRITTVQGEPVAGAAVWFAGRRARAGHDGVARIAATLHGHGRRTARATRHGFGPARRTILVRRSPD
jgi:hypothetical protein